jgi:hypothetical protein
MSTCITPLKLRAVLRMRASCCRTPAGERGVLLALRDLSGLFAEVIEGVWIGPAAVAFLEQHQTELVAGRGLDLEIDRFVAQADAVVARIKSCQLAPLPPSWIKHAERVQHAPH